jgi:PAS domain S-box-containing protein
MSEYVRECLREDEEFTLYRARASAAEPSSVLLLTPASIHPRPESLRKIEHEYSLCHDFDPTWAVRPLALSECNGQKALVLEDPGGEFLHRLIQGPMEIKQFLRIAIGLSTALGQLHNLSVIHKDLKPSNVLVDTASGHAWLTGFGIASRLLRERQSPGPPEFIAGTLPYMAPEQTGRMNRSIDLRSDLYALGVTLYEMLTGSLPFTASDPMDWVHCHIARQPAPPDGQVKGIPRMLSAIIMKLLAKIAEERYQTAIGVERDLRRCLDEWETQHHVDEFPPGERDFPDRLMIPEKLYGRGREVDALLAAFDRVVTQGRPELVLVSGYSGVGKSSLVNELHKVLIPPRGLFAAGKFDQYKRDIPYATLAQAFEMLVRQILVKSEAEVLQWRDALKEALGPNGQLISKLVPEVEFLIGKQPPAPDLPPQDAQRRFQLVFRRFLSVFARSEHPLALFLDDLQWPDAATLDFIEDLLTASDVTHLILILAYRDNEVDSSHPLIRKLEAIRKAGATVQEIVLAPLTREDLEHLIADAIHCEPGTASPLAQLIHDKTAGNTFFAIQFITSLTEEGLLVFDHCEGRWSWDLARINAKGYTENVVDLMVEKLGRLPGETRNALKLLACLGNSTEFTALHMVFQEPEEDIHNQLWEAVRAGLIFRSEGSYTFLHDRIHEAAYSLITVRSRADTHLRIGRLLAKRTPPEKLEEAVFEIVNQLNRGSDLITSTVERERLAELNLMAGRRAKLSTAYAAALKYFTLGRELLTDDACQRNSDLIFSIECLLAECELLIGNLMRADDRLSRLAQRAKGSHEMAVVTRLRLTAYTALDRSDRGVEVCLEYLRRDGSIWPLHPTADEVRREYDRVWAVVGSREIEEFIDLPLMTNPEVLDILEVLTEVVTPAVFFDERLSSFLLCRMVGLSLDHGNTSAGCFAYVWFAVTARSHFGNYKDAFRFGRLGYDLVEKRGLTKYQARTYMSFGNLVIPSARHAMEGRELLRRAFEAAYQNGDLTFGAYSLEQLITNLLAVGDPLTEVQREAENGLAFSQKAQFGLVVDLFSAQVQLVRMLRGLTTKFGCFNDAHFDELEFERHFASNPVLADAEFGYWALKAQAQFLAGDYDSAVQASLKAQQLLWSAPSLLEPSAFRFYSALSYAAAWDSSSLEQRQQFFDEVLAHQRQLEIWSENCPANFENRAALVGAEVARIEGRLLDAEGLYEKAIRSARVNGFIHNEAVAYEVAARFYAARGFDKIADTYLREARYCYSRWGADGKVRHLDQFYPHMKKEGLISTPTTTILAPAELLDLATVIKVSQATSGEMVVEKLIDRVMRAAIEHAGAERGLLVIPRGDELQIAAEVTTSETDFSVHQRNTSIAAAFLPESVVRYVMRTRENVILGDATARNPFSDDPYIGRHRVRSIVCLPLVNQAKLNGIIYLENNLTAHVFTSERITVLKVLASQAAISLENSRLYRDLENREAKIRRLVDANVMAVVIWRLDGAIVESNEAFLRLVQYDREDVATARVRWTDLTPTEWREHDERALAEIRATGSVQPYEKELFRKDGSRVPVLVAGALFEEGGNEGVAFALDLSEQKRAEEAFRRSESYLAQAQRLARIGSWVLEVPARNALYISGEWYRIYDFDPKDGMPTWEQLLQRVHPEDRSRWQVTIDRAIAEKSDFDVEFRILPPRSTIKYIHSVGHPVWGSSGELLQFIGVAMDVTDRKRSEEALRSSEAYLTEAQMLTHTGSCAMDGTSREILYWSEEMFRLFGFDPHQGLPKWDQWLQGIHPEDRDKFKLASDKTFLKKVDCDLEFRIVKPDGTVGHIHGIGHPVLSPNGELAQVVGTMVDITDRMSAEEALKRSETYLAQAQRVANIGSWVFDTVRMNPVHLSGEWHRLQGFDPKDGMPTWEQRLQRIHPEDRARYEEAFNRAIAEKSDLDAEFRILLPDSTIRYIRSVGHPVLDALGEVTQMMGVIMDVTESRQAEQQHERLREELAHLSHLNRVSTIGELTASLAHEIKQPIGAAVTNAQACLRFLDGERLNLIDAREAASEMVLDARRAADIVDRVRSLYRKDSSHHETVDLNDLIREMIVMLRDEANRHSVTTCTDLAEGLPKVMADRVQLQQALMNLMLNGIEAMRDTTGELSIRSRLAEDQQVQISVTDAGVGLPSGKADQIFNAFFTTKPQGTGLGLVITRSIVESHGGRVWATANSGRGATFYFRLPSIVAVTG